MTLSRVYYWKVESMSCCACKKRILEAEDFVLVGKYPSNGQIWANSNLKGHAPPEAYGTIYHKECYLKMAEGSKK